MPTLGFLHTADVHVPTFRTLRAELAPSWAEVHTVDASLLADARTAGITDALTDRLDAHLRELAAAGADVILCTCSTLGGVAEKRPSTIPVVRVDRPMAEAAVTAGPRVAVVHTVASTLSPTMTLLHESATRLGLPCTPVPAPCLTAWQAFESGSLDVYATQIAEAARQTAGSADVVILAQASMAPAAALLTDLAIPVLTSPRAAVTAVTRTPR